MSERPTDRQLFAGYRRSGTITALANDLGVAFETARRWLLEANVQIKPKGRPSKSADRLDTEALTKRYRAGESIATIGTSCGVSPATVRARLIEAGVELRPRRGWKY